MAGRGRGIRIAGVGCAVADFFYPRVDFTGAHFRQYLSVVPADGGLEPGGLVFRKDFEAFAGIELDTFLDRIAGDTDQVAFNVGGPPLVAMVAVAQLLHGRDAHVSFHGTMGDDEIGRRIRSALAQTPLDICNYRVKDGPTPNTCVLSDPGYHGGHGERTFISTMGAAGRFGPEDLGDDFFGAGIRVFGGTALVPRVHAALTALLCTGKEQGGVDVVHTVYDFPSEKKNPGARWPLGSDEGTYPLIDLLVMDAEESLRISGLKDLDAACEYFASGGVRALAVTHGVKPVRFYSDGSRFRPCSLSQLPVSERVVKDRAALGRGFQGDTTGCGDNFVGGMIAAMAAQSVGGRPEGEWDLAQAVAVGICAGGCACFHLGGLHIEAAPGEKAEIVSRYYRHYRRQVESLCALPEHPL